MRLQTVLIWVVVAGILAGVVVLTRSGAAGSAAARAEEIGTWTIPIDPARVVSLQRTDSERPGSSAERTGPDRWTLRWNGEDGQARSWNADPARVRAALRLLGTAGIIRSPEESGVTPTNTLLVTESDGRSVEIWFGSRAAGGQTPVVVLVKGADGIAERRVDGRIGSGVPDAFVRADWSAWRDPTLFDATPTTTDTVSIQTQANRVTLERGARGWSITEPFRHEADAAEIERMIGVLRSMQASGFEDGSHGDPVTGLSDPIATVRTAGGTGERTLRVGRNVDTDGRIRFATITAGDQSAMIRVDAESLSQITAVPEAYARRTPLGIGAEEIGRVRLVGPDGRTRFEAVRDGGEWTIGDGQAVPLQRDAVERLLRVLTAERAAAVGFVPRDPELRGSVGTVVCMTREGLPLPAIRLRTEQGPDGMRLLMAIDTEGDNELVWTGVSEQAKGVVAWAAALVRGG